MTEPVLITPAAEEPITLAEAKAHCRVDGTDEDTLISGLIVAAREYVEDMTGRALVTSTWDYYLDRFPWSDACSWSRHDIKLPKGKLQSVTSIKYTDSSGNQYTLDPSTYHALTAREPGAVRLAHGASWPPATLRSGEAVVIRFVAGYDNAAAVPQSLKNAMLLLIGWWYENREAAVVGNSASAVSAPIAFGVQALVANRRVWM
jgi:uncharacterized phiE125 gp8 family phage protein